MTPLDLLLACAPLVAPVTMSALIEQESGGHPLALHDNSTGVSYQPRAESDAVELARRLMQSGHSVDIGLAQINSNNLSWLGQSVETIFKPCANLKAAQTVLLVAWQQSGGQLNGALSAYNTGKVNGSVGARYAAAVYDKAVHPAAVVAAIPGGKLPAWVSQQLEGAGNIDPAQVTPEMMQTRASIQTAPVRAVPRPPQVTPANSPLQPDQSGLRP